MTRQDIFIYSSIFTFGRIKGAGGYGALQSMIIHLKELLLGPRHVDLRLESNWWGRGDPNHQVLGLDGPLQAHLTLFRTGERCFVDGEISGRIWAVCDRCAESFSHGVESRFALILVPMPTEPLAGEIELSEEDMLVEFLTEEEVEIDHLVREQVYLSLPVKFLCHEGCKGLCPACGANLNRETCRCEREIGHPAFLRLKEWRTGKDIN